MAAKVQAQPETATAFWSSAACSRLQNLDMVSAFSAASILSPAVETLQVELFAIEAAARLVRARLNSLVTISRLHPEILAHIFAALVDIDPPKRPDYTRPEESLKLGWIKVSFVCRTWRQVALAHPHLWRHISLELGLRWAEEHLVRSRAAPITMRIGMATAPTEPFEANLFRTEELHLMSQYLHSEASILSLPAPLLKSFTWKIYRPIEHPFILFAHRAPQLRSLRVYIESPFPWDSPVLHSEMRDLQIGGHPQCVGPSALQFVGALRRMPHLRSLVLTDCLPTGLSSSSAVELPLLINLELCGPFEALAEVFLHLSLPHPDLRVHLRCRSTGPGVVEDPALFIRTIERLSSVGRPAVPLQTFDIHDDIHDFLFWRAWRTYEATADRANFFPSLNAADDRLPDISMQFDHSPHTDFSRLIAHVCRVLPLDDLRVLSVNLFQDSMAMRDFGWLPAFWHRCRQLEHVRIGSERISESLVGVLCQSLPAQNPMAPQGLPEGEQAVEQKTGAEDLEVGILFPRLSTMEYWVAYTSVEETLWMWLSLLEARRLAGSPVAVYRIDSSHAPVSAQRVDIASEAAMA